MCVKVTRAFIPHNSMVDEIKKLHQIQTLAFSTPVRVPKLRGLITSHKGIIGLLMDYISSIGYHLQCTLRSANTIDRNRRKKWSRQIEETLVELHSQDIIWGDAKSTNVLIDEVSDDSWVIDFGGGNAEGWMDSALHGTVAGDLQALERIKKELADC